MRMVTMDQAQKNLPKLLKQTSKGAIGLTDQEGHLLGVLSALDDDRLDDLLVQTADFKRMIARSRASRRRGGTISASVLLREARMTLSKSQRRTAQKSLR